MNRTQLDPLAAPRPLPKIPNQLEGIVEFHILIF